MLQRLGTGSGGRRPPWRVHYATDTITITSRYVQVAGTRIATSELHDVVRCLTYGYPLLRVAAVTGGVELLVAAPVAVAYGSAMVACAGLLTAAGMALAAYADHRRNPRLMTIEATVHGHRVELFRTLDEREFGQVWRALVRATENIREPLP